MLHIELEEGQLLVREGGAELSLSCTLGARLSADHSANFLGAKSSAEILKAVLSGPGSIRISEGASCLTQCAHYSQTTSPISGP